MFFSMLLFSVLISVVFKNFFQRLLDPARMIDKMIASSNPFLADLTCIKTDGPIM